MTATLDGARAAGSPGPGPAGARRARPPLPAWRPAVAITWLLFCALALWAVTYILFVSGFQHARAQHELYAKFRSELALVTAPIGGTITTGAPVALFTVPGAGLHGEVAVEGTDAGTLRAGPGHVRTSPLPGQAGVSMFYGRSLSFGAPFGRVASLPVGAPITVTTDQGTFHYSVIDVRQAGDPWTLPAAGASELTLVTTDGGWMPDRVVYVDAALQGKTVPAPSGRPATSPSDEKLMARQTDSLTLVIVVLWLQLLVVVAVLLTWLRSRWRPTQVWLVAVPAVLATLWGLSNAAAPLLPNLL
jgi:sortase A